MHSGITTSKAASWLSRDTKADLSSAKVKHRNKIAAQSCRSNVDQPQMIAVVPLGCGDLAIEASQVGVSIQPLFWCIGLQAIDAALSCSPFSATC